MTAAFDLVTFDTPDTGALAAFWSAALDLVELQREDGDRWVVLGTVTGQRVIGIQRAPARPGGVHLDLACAAAEFTAEVTRLIALGAGLLTPVRHEPYGAIANLADPAGYAFDLCTDESW